VAIHGSLFPRPQLALHQLEISNPEWAAADNLLNAEKVTLTPSLIYLLKGEMRLEKLNFSDSTLNLEQRANAPVNESARLAQQDSLKAVQIKARLLEAQELAGAAIDVELEDDHAILRGFVETAQQRDHAEAIAQDQDEVKTVENNIIVK
jgi:hyperosmotically inducible periplasmic protein